MKFSVIIPVYNAESTLDRCVNSILQQDYQDIEIILINDGSKDNSLKKCLNLEQIDNRIKVLNKKNEGVALARNDGLFLATGDYVYFVDPDDEVRPGLFQKCVEVLLNSKILYDVIVFGHEKQIYSGESVFSKQIISDSFSVVNDRNLKRKYLTDMYLSGVGFSAWDKVINRKFLTTNELKFPKLKRGQDMAFCANVFEKCNSILCINQVYYIYYDFNTTKNNKCDPNILQNHEYIFNQLSKIFYENFDDSFKNIFLQDIYLKWFFYVVPQNILKSDTDDKKNVLKEMYNDDFFKKTLSLYKIRYTKNLKNKILLFIMKMKSVNFHVFCINCINHLNFKLLKYKEK